MKKSTISPHSNKEDEEKKDNFPVDIYIHLLFVVKMGRGSNIHTLSHKNGSGEKMYQEKKKKVGKAPDHTNRLKERYENKKAHTRGYYKMRFEKGI